MCRMFNVPGSWYDMTRDNCIAVCKKQGNASRENLRVLGSSRVAYLFGNESLLRLKAREQVGRCSLGLFAIYYEG